MKPVVAVVAATYEDARRWVLDNRALIGVDHRLVSSSRPVDYVLGMEVGRIVTVPGAETGRHFDQIKEHLDRCALRYAKPLT